MKKIFIAFLFCLTLIPAMHAQGEGEDAKESEPTQVPEIFYGTRTVNLHTVKQMGHKVLAYRISHRFGSLRNDFLYNFLGLDGPANISFMFDYGLTDNLMIGVARDQFNKTYSGYTKYNILNQQSGGGSPVTLAVYGRGNILTQRSGAAPGAFDRYENFAHRMSYTAQILVARRFGERFALQIAPTYIHHNLVELSDDKNDIFAVAASGQVMLTKRLGLSGEFTYAVNNYASPAGPNFYPCGALGLDIVTGGHVFQIILTNSPIINETVAIPFNRQNLLDGDLRLGFNISRNFWL
jgi:hypothetical protein